MVGTVLTELETSKLILERIQKYFQAKRHHQYWLEVVNNQYLHEYNWFIEVVNPLTYEHSIPLHSITKQDLTYLERVVGLVKQENHLTIKYRHFDDLVWPISQKKIR